MSRGGYPWSDDGMTDPFEDMHPFSPEAEARREERRQERAEAQEDGTGTKLINVHASGSGGDGYYRRGWRAENTKGPWAQLINLPEVNGWQNIIVIVGWRPRFSLTLDVTRRKP